MAAGQVGRNNQATTNRLIQPATSPPFFLDRRVHGRIWPVINLASGLAHYGAAQPIEESIVRVHARVTAAAASGMPPAPVTSRVGAAERGRGRGGGTGWRVWRARARTRRARLAVGEATYGETQRSCAGTPWSSASRAASSDADGQGAGMVRRRRAQLTRDMHGSGGAGAPARSRPEAG